jgi:FolB domain-containing protein
MTERRTILIERLAVSCVIGLLEDERNRQQTLVVSLELAVELDRNRLDDLDPQLDYTNIARAIEKKLKEGQYLTIERAAHELAQDILSRLPKPQTKGLKIRLLKPEALGGNGIPGVTYEFTNL